MPRPRSCRVVLPLLPLLLTVSACGDDGASGSDVGADPAPSTTSLEAITPAGVAGVVREVLGADRIATYTAAGESDSVGVLVRLDGRQLLVVSVQVTGEAPISSCDDLADRVMREGDCSVTDDGTIVASGRAEPFSDDNTNGSTVLAQSVNPESGRVVYALYETYSPRPALDPRTITEIVTDPALAAMTDPATNEAGADIELTSPED